MKKGKEGNIKKGRKGTFERRWFEHVHPPCSMEYDVRENGAYIHTYDSLNLRDPADGFLSVITSFLHSFLLFPHV